MSFHCQVPEGEACVSKPVAFKAYRQFNDEAIRRHAGSSYRLNVKGASFFPGDNFPDRLARALAEKCGIRLKEVVESFEFFERVRRRVRAPHMADLCCGHGLVGMLFAAMERCVEKVLLIDKRKPQSYEALLETVCEVAPWVADKITYHECKLSKAAALLQPGTSVVGVHACGIRTESCIDIAMAVGGAVAVLPCCYGQTGSDAPLALQRSLGVITATDIHRTYILENGGYEVSWSAIPREITPMNRVISAAPRVAGISES